MYKRSHAPLAVAAAASTAQHSAVWLAKRCAPTKVRAMQYWQKSWLIQFVFLWRDVLANYSAPNGPISILIEVLDSWLQC